MVRRSLIVAALLAVSSPLAAQEEYVWSSDRPDAHASIGVTGDRTLPAGAMEVTYRFSQLNSQGVWFLTDSLPLVTTLQLYDVAPLSLSQQTHSVYGAMGVTDQLTVLVSAEFSLFEREQLTSTGTYYITSVQQLGDVTATALYEVYREGPMRVNLSVGGVIPTGKARTWGATPFSGAGQEALPYDTRPGGGSFAVVPGATVSVQNEYGSVGGQFKARIPVGPGAVDFVLGDRYQADGWAAYRFNDAISISAGLRWQIWGNIEGADPNLVTTRDPGSNPVFTAGQRADLPVGINLVVPDASPFAGHRLFLEAVYALHHDYEGPQLGLDWGINFGWRMGL